MAMLTENRHTGEREAVFRRMAVRNGEIMFDGGMAALDINDNCLAMAKDAPNLRVVGRVEEYVDNSENGKYCTVRTGCFLLDNSTLSPITNDSIGRSCFVEDDHTVSNNTGNNAIVAGIVFEVVSDGVWVCIGAQIPVIAYQPEQTSNIIQKIDVNELTVKQVKELIQVLNIKRG